MDTEVQQSLAQTDNRPLMGNHVMAGMEEEDEHLTDYNLVGQNPGAAPFSTILTTVIGLVLFPYSLFSCYSVDVMTETLVFYWGRYHKTVKEPGVHWDIRWGRGLVPISTKRITCDLTSSTIVDMNGSPLLISAVVVYKFVDTMRAALCVEKADQFIRTQALAVLKQVVSRFPYESSDPTIPCLKKEVEIIGQQLVEVLQAKVNVAGAQIMSFQLKEITYAPEIADGMLRRQQAGALVEARHTIVVGAVSIAVDALKLLDEQNIHMNEEEKTKLVTNLLTVICSERATQPTLPLGRA